jgi:hypothetical protein
MTDLRKPLGDATVEDLRYITGHEHNIKAQSLLDAMIEQGVDTVGELDENRCPRCGGEHPPINMTSPSNIDLINALDCCRRVIDNDTAATAANLGISVEELLIRQGVRPRPEPVQAEPETEPAQEEEPEQRCGCGHQLRVHRNRYFDKFYESWRSCQMCLDCTGYEVVC